MTVAAPIDLSEAKAAYVVANMPVYLIRRLQNDFAAHRINELMTAKKYYMSSNG